MIIKEVGFRPLYHFVCAFELNDVLREVVRECPEIDKASHMVTYGYIDPKEGMMLEVLGVGKQAPKYFYFKEPYQGKRITLHASEVEDIDFMYFPELENRFYKKYVPRIEELKQYDASEQIEESRKLDFLDGCRSNQYPDDVEVLLLKKGLKKEKVWVHITGLGDHCINGTLLNEPFQKFGVSQDEAISFNVRKKPGSPEQVECYIDFDEDESVVNINADDLKDGTLIKKLIADVREKKDENLFGFLLAVLRSSRVILPCNAELSDTAKQILQSHSPEEEISDEDFDKITSETRYIPIELESDSEIILPAFTTIEEIENNLPDAFLIEFPFIKVIEHALGDDSINVIVINIKSDGFAIDKELFEIINKMEPLFEVDESLSIVSIPSDREKDDASTPPSSIQLSQTNNGIALSVGKMSVFNYAAFHCGIAPINDIRIVNVTGSPMKGLSLHITSDYDFMNDYEAFLPDIPSGKPLNIDAPNLVINGQKLAEQTELKNANILIEVRNADKTLCSVRGIMKVYAYDQWQGGAASYEILPAFVMPNHPVIPQLMQEAANRLKKWGKPASIEGYQQNDPNRVRDLAAAAYAAIQKCNITYANPPASFSYGQRIRTPEIIMDQHFGTCMDMTLLYSALIELMGLDPILVMQDGHIFAGVWLKERTKEELITSDVLITNVDQLIKRIDNGSDELTFIECTKMCSGNPVSFEDAERIAKMELHDVEQFRIAIDVSVARTPMHGIIPIDPRIKNGTDFVVKVSTLEEEDITTAPKNLGLSISDVSASGPKKITGKVDLWESKLLDLTLHNMLLNLPHNSSIEPIMSYKISELEDALYDGHEFSINPLPIWIEGLSFTEVDKNGKKSKPKLWIEEEIKANGIYEIYQWPSVEGDDFGERIRQDYHNHCMYSFSTAKQLDRELTSIYRAARSSQQENGVSSLYLAVGMLRWYEDNITKEARYAPLLLIPVEMVRKAGNMGYALRARDEDPHFNATLFEMLKQNYNVNIAGLEPLPVDEHGIDVKKVFKIVRSSVLSLPRWDVVETCALGNFKFAQFAMWNDIHTAGEKLNNSKLVRSLIKGHMDWEPSIREDVEKLYLPLTADETQQKAIRMAAEGKTFVLHGPPGTGKSQTITCMIANLMAQGKTVLFVAEKKAALEVVEDRLTKLELDDFCLELHSDKADKKHVLNSFENVLKRSTPSKTDYEEYSAKTKISRSRLDEYAEHLHKVQRSGYSLRELVALYETVRDCESYIPFDRDAVSSLSQELIKTHISLIEQLIDAGSVVDNIANSPFRNIGLKAYDAEVRSHLRRYAIDYINALKETRDSSQNVAALIGVSVPQNQTDLSALSSLIKMFNENKNTRSMFAKLHGKRSEEIRVYHEMRDRVQTLYNWLIGYWKPEFLTQNMDVYLIEYNAALKKLIRKATHLEAVANKMRAYATFGFTYDDIPRLIETIQHYQGEVAKLNEYYNSLSDNTKSLIAELPNTESYKRAVEMAKECEKKAAEFPGGIDAITTLAQDETNVEAFNQLANRISELEKAEKQFNELLERQENPDNPNWFDEEIEFCNFVSGNISELKTWGAYNSIKHECFAAGLKPVVTAFEEGMDATIIIDAYRKGLYYALIYSIIDNDDVLSCFSGTSFNSAIDQFKKLDEKLLTQTKNEIGYILSKNIPSPIESPEIGIELNLLRKAIGSNARGMTIRTLFERIPNILPRLFPCMLMSPNSVAQYLEQKENLFDIVIFDEASQLPTCKAIGSLYRAKDAVVVGDPKQMPPTSFFSGGGPEVDDLALDDLDSILDDAIALGVPSQYLQWHYRSLHESLITFSNITFYGNKMYTFPAANDREQHVKFVFVGGQYIKNTNKKEAEAIVEEVVKRFNNPELRSQSIGIVTFNIKQMDLIENLLAKQCQNNPEFDLWINDKKNPVFVKNLENVQGDERDVILFSICYGPDEKGHVLNNFGPINKEGGGKRLNVAFSRSRLDMIIFSSMHSSDIKVKEDSPDGVKAFYSFMKYAEGNELRAEDGTAVNKTDLSKAGILKSICKALDEHGYKFDTMVGKSNFRVDIAVVDPYDEAQYMLGIMLDGDGYRMIKDTRDREVAQPDTLRRLGWQLCRVWTIDWLDNREKEIKKLLDLAESLSATSKEAYERKLAEEEARKAAEQLQAASDELLREEIERQAQEVMDEAEDENSKHVNSQEAPITIVDDSLSANDDNQQVASSVEHDSPVAVEIKDSNPTGIVYSAPVEYIVADIPSTDLSQVEFADSKKKSEVSDRIISIVDIEAPILKESLMRRIFASYGISKTSSSLDAFDKAFKYSKTKTTKMKGSVFCWNSEQDPDSYSLIRSGSDRNIDEICLQEIKNAACYVLKQNGPMTKDDLIKEVSLLFGYKRLGKNVEIRIAESIQWAKSRGDIIMEDKKYNLP